MKVKGNMFLKKIVLKPETKDHIYTSLCNKMEKQGVFKACGSCDDKWIIGQWEDVVDFFAWCVAMDMDVKSIFKIKENAK